MHFSAKRGIAIVYCLSVRECVTFRYRDYIGWNSSNIISRLISLEKVNEDRPILSAAKCGPMILVSRNVRFLRIFAGVS